MLLFEPSQPCANGHAPLRKLASALRGCWQEICVGKSSCCFLRTLVVACVFWCCATFQALLLSRRIRCHVAYAVALFALISNLKHSPYERGTVYTGCKYRDKHILHDCTRGNTCCNFVPARFNRFEVSRTLSGKTFVHYDETAVIM